MSTIQFPRPPEEGPDIASMTAEELLEWAAVRSSASQLELPPLVPLVWRTADADYLVNIHFVMYSPPAEAGQLEDSL